MPSARANSSGVNAITEGLDWVTLRNFHKGWAPKALLPGEALQMTNLQLDREFKAVPCPGASAMTQGLSGFIAQGMALWTGTPNMWVFVYNGKLAHVPVADPHPYTLTPLYSAGIQTTRPVQILPFGSLLIIIGLAAKPLKYNGTTVTTVGGSPPNATHGIISNGRLLVCDDTTNRVYISGAGTVDSWDALDWFDVGETGKPVNALATAGDAVYCFKAESVWQLTGRTLSDFYLRQAMTGIGVNYWRTMAINAVAEGDMTFLDFEHLWSKAGPLVDISAQLEGGGIGHQSFPYASCVDMTTQRLYLSVPTGATTGYSVVLDLKKKSWYKWDIYNVTCWFKTGSVLYAGLRTGNFIQIDDSLTAFLGSPIATAFEEQRTDFGLPNVEKYLRKMILRGKTAVAPTGVGTLTVSYRMTDEGTWSTVTKTGLTLPCVVRLPKKRCVQMKYKLEVSESAGQVMKNVSIGYLPVRSVQ